ncbi:MAG: acyl-homoserine-lactone synthase [Sphingobium sp.]
MLHLITNDNRDLYAVELDALHRARKSVFIDELGWQLRVRDGMEHDEYDDERAMHIVGFDSADAVSASIRVRPADDRSMLVDHFSHHLPRGMRPVDDGRTWEVSRGFSRERGLKRAVLQRKAACMVAPLEIALEAGIDRYVGFTDVRLLGVYYHFGWKLDLLGDPMPYGEGDGVAYAAEVSSSIVRSIRQTWGLPAPAYVQVKGLDGATTVHAAARAIAGDDPLRLQFTAPALDVPDAAPRTGRIAALARARMQSREAVATPQKHPATVTEL